MTASGGRGEAQRFGAFAAQRTNDFAGIAQAAHVAGRNAREREHGRPPLAGPDIEIKGIGLEAALGDGFAREPIEQIVLQQQHFCRAGEDLRLVAAQPQHFAGRPGGRDVRLAGDLEHLLVAELGGNQAGLLDRAVIEPDDGVAGGPSGGIQQDDGLTLAGDAERAHVGGHGVALVQGIAHGPATGLPVGLRVQLYDGRRRHEQGVFLPVNAQQAALFVENGGLHRGGSRVNPQIPAHVIAPLSGRPARLSCPRHAGARPR